MSLSWKLRFIFGANTEQGVNKLAFQYHPLFIPPNNMQLVVFWPLIPFHLSSTLPSSFMT